MLIMYRNNTQEYSLSELLSTTNRKIIIPDFQRDYCWGDKTHGHGENKTDIISSFLDTLIEEFNSNRDTDVLLGKIDVYEHPKNHIYLTDGQQRLTSLYLLLGMLYRNEEDTEQKEKIRCCLISDFEETQNDNEPYLQYAVRESTIFFLKDLVIEFFVGDKVLLEEEYKIAKSTKQIKDDESLVSFTIKNQPWYFSEYDLDPSIISMLSALSIIEKKRKDIDIKGFSKFIINNVKIQYYDVKDKKHGEERFVIINTTGKSLTVSENIKPILLANLENPELSKQWEERETYFWKNKNEKENIADIGVNDFLTWCFKIIDKQDEVDILKNAKQLLKEKKNETCLLEIQNLFNSLIQLIKYLKEEKFQKQFKFINDNKEVRSIIDFRNLTNEKRQNLLFPLLSFISKFENNKENTCLLLRRLRKNYFDLKWKDRNSNYIDWRYILQIIEKSNSIEQILQYDTNDNTISRIQNVPLNNWFSDEEKLKVKLSDYKNGLEEWEDHIDFMGDLSFLFQTYLIKNDDLKIPTFNIELSIEIQNLQKIFNNYHKTIDLIRSENNARANILLANLFRLFRLFIGCNEVGHIYRASWDFEGVLFSTLNREHLFKPEYMKLMKTDNILDYCKSYIKQEIKEKNIFDLTEFTADKFIKAWLTLKVFYANEQNELLAFYDGNETGVAAYIDKDRNRLVDNIEFSLANSICGFGVKSGFGRGNSVHTTGESLWCKSHIIDTPFSDIAFEKNKRSKEQIEKNGKTIERILKLITF